MRGTAQLHKAIGLHLQRLLAKAWRLRPGGCPVKPFERRFHDLFPLAGMDGQGAMVDQQHPQRKQKGVAGIIFFRDLEALLQHLAEGQQGKIPGEAQVQIPDFPFLHLGLVADQLVHADAEIRGQLGQEGNVRQGRTGIT